MAKRPGEKFFFDMNVFDENGMELRELEANKPPPRFGIEIVETARQEGFSRGRAAGLAESQASRDQHVAKVLEKIAGDVAVLFDGENDREKIYEMESARLALAIFKKIFPLYNEKYGFEELKGALENILEKTSGRGEIAIDVHPDYASEIEKHIKCLPSAAGTDLQIAVRGNDTLGQGDCRLSWRDGGAVRNSLEMADKIVAALEEALAAGGVNVHDDIVKDEESVSDEQESVADETQPGDSQ